MSDKRRTGDMLASAAADAVVAGAGTMPFEHISDAPQRDISGYLPGGVLSAAARRAFGYGYRLKGKT
jgi:hypothetical protein